MDPNVRHLRSFLAVVDELHFGRAAQRLGIAQPAVSRHIRQLEEQLGTPLFVRTARETRLTSAGAAAVSGARRIVAESTALGRAVDEAAAGQRGEVRVGFVASTISQWLPRLEGAMRDRPGGVELITSQRTVARVCDEIRASTIDVALTRWIDDEALNARLLGFEPIVAVLPPGHALSARTELSVAEIDDEPLIVTGARTWRTGFENQIAGYREAGLRCLTIREAGGPAEALAFVRAGVGIHLRAQSGVDGATDLEAIPVAGMRSALIALRSPSAPDAATAVIDELQRIVTETLKV